MQILAQLGGGAFTLACLLIGLRLLLLSARTRHLPELLVGLALFLMAGIGYPLSSIARQVPGLAPETRAALGCLGALFVVIGVISNTAFIWLLFRRDTGWARALLAGVTLIGAGLFAAESLAGSWATGSAFFWPGIPSTIMLSMGWGFVECARYHGMLRRRLRLDLADPVVTDRFRLYAAATLLGFITNAVGWIFWWLRLEMLTDPVGAPLLAVLGAGSAVFMWLAFLPPQAYLAHVQARARSRQPVTS
jgi:hypothetical protein